MHSMAWWPVLIVVVIASATDLTTRRIPNWLVLPFLIAGVVVASWTRGWSGAGQSVTGVLLGTVVYGALCAMGGMGMGDVKLVAAIGAWIGPSQLFVALILTGLTGAVMALGWAVAGGFAGELLGNTRNLLGHIGRRGIRPHAELVLSHERARKMPYAPAIAIGTLASFLAH